MFVCMLIELENHKILQAGCFWSWQIKEEGKSSSIDISGQLLCFIWKEPHSSEGDELWLTGDFKECSVPKRKVWNHNFSKIFWFISHSVSYTQLVWEGRYQVHQYNHNLLKILFIHENVQFRTGPILLNKMGPVPARWDRTCRIVFNEA